MDAMAPRPERAALRERYERRQQEMVDTAARVFAQRGYEQTTVQELTEAMGLAAGALYHYFGSKEQLLIRICDELVEPLLVQARALLRSAGTPEQQFRALVRLWVEHVTAHRDHMLVFEQHRAAIEAGDQWREVRASRKQFQRLVEKALDGALDGAGTDRRLALSALLGMVNYTAQWYRPRGRLAPAQIADGYVDLVLGRPGT
jgi:AcrR family transcriptional regulator